MKIIKKFNLYFFILFPKENKLSNNKTIALNAILNFKLIIQCITILLTNLFVKEVNFGSNLNCL